jgi:membrane protease YdiL (CAAX protease family)
MIIGSGIAIALLSGQSGGRVTDMTEAMRNPANAGLMRMVQVISVFLSMILPVLLIGWLVNRRPMQLIGFRSGIKGRQVVLVLGIVVLSVMVAGVLGMLNKEIGLTPNWKAQAERLEKAYAEQVSMMVNLKSFGGYLVSLLLMAVLPALGEEMLFRGGLQNFLTRATNNPWLSIIIVSIIFSVIHFSFFGFLPRLFLGVVLGAIFFYTQNLWLAVFAHFLNNAFAVTAMYVYVRRGKGLQEAMNDDVVSYWALLFLSALIYLFLRLKNTAPVNDLTEPTLPQNSFNDGAERTNL